MNFISITTTIRIITYASCSPCQSSVDYVKHEKTKHAVYNELGSGSATLLHLAFLRESDPTFPWDKFTLGQQSVQNTKLQKTTCRERPEEEEERRGELGREGVEKGAMGWGVGSLNH